VGVNSGNAERGASNPYRGGGIELTMLPAPDATGYHDTPKAGVTALIAQVSPAQHGSNLVKSKGNRSYNIPFNSKEGGLTLERQEGVPVPCPYRELQDAMLRFFSDAFEGKVPVVTGLPAPKRDLDGDGTPDSSDPAPSNPASK
jgi:hypothetical protein